MEPTINSGVTVQEESFLLRHATLVTFIIVLLHISSLFYLVKYRGVLDNPSDPLEAIWISLFVELSIPLIIFFLGLSNFYGKRKEIFRGLLWSLVFILAPIIWLILLFLLLAIGSGGR